MCSFAALFVLPDARLGGHDSLLFLFGITTKYYVKNIFIFR